MAAFHGVFDKLFYAVIDSLFSLVMCLCGIHTAGRLGCVSARIRHLFEQDYILARLGCIDRRSHTCTAGAYDHDIRIQILLVFLSNLFFLFGRESIEVCAGIPHGFLGCTQDGIAGDGRTCQRINVGALRFHDPIIEHIYGKGSDIFSFLIAFDLDFFDLIFRNGDSYINRTAETCCCLSISAGDKQIALRSPGTGINLGAACLCKRFRGCQLDGITGKGRTRHCIDIGVLLCQDGLLEQGDRRAADIGCFTLACNGQI